VGAGQKLKRAVCGDDGPGLAAEGAGLGGGGRWAQHPWARNKAGAAGIWARRRWVTRPAGLGDGLGLAAVGVGPAARGPEIKRAQATNTRNKSE
jgi:hypothetical protein